MDQTNFENFVEHVGRTKRAWQGHAPFSVQNYYTRTVEYVCMVLFASCRESSKLILKILSSMSDSPQGRGRATPLFHYKIIKEE